MPVVCNTQLQFSTEEKLIQQCYRILRMIFMNNHSIPQK